MTGTAILVPLDGSPSAEAALPYAVALASAMGEELCLFAVAERPDFGRLTGQNDLADDVLRVRHEGLRLYLDEVAARPALAALTSRRQIATGNPVDEILSAAADPSISLTAMATHGRGGVTRLLLGSVADKVMRLNTGPTLVVRSSDPPAPAHDIRIERIMVPLDGSPLAEAALAPAARYARALDAKILLVRSVQPLDALVLSDGNYVDYSDADKAQDRAALAYLSAARARLGTEVASELLVVEQSPLQLPQYALDAGVDLVVMTTRGNGGMKRLALGSVADRMARLGPSVLLVPAQVRETSEEAQHSPAAVAPHSAQA
jgi:nucleotide-binding universal stress UspA family protein